MNTTSSNQLNTSQIRLALLGDSIFDNARYVDGGPAVIDQVRAALPSGSVAHLVAHDGDVAANILNQADRTPREITHLVLSIGGNDALGAIPAMSLPAANVGQALGILSKIRLEFHATYRQAIRTLAAMNVPIAVCTVYENVPGLTEDLKTALAIFNDVITREAIAVHAHVIDLRSICTEDVNYSKISPIEPSSQGGEKIAKAIADWVRQTPPHTPHQ